MDKKQYRLQTANSVEDEVLCGMYIIVHDDGGFDSTTNNLNVSKSVEH